MAKLIDAQTQQERQLVKATTLIGRAEYCDICIRDRLVSREHARLLRKLTGYYVEDLGSTHGTRVNNIRIRRRAKLHDGDVITVAMVRHDGRCTVPPRPIHTDTTMPSHQTPPQDSDPPTEVDDAEDTRVGATFIFRR